MSSGIITGWAQADLRVGVALLCTALLVFDEYVAAGIFWKLRWTQASTAGAWALAEPELAHRAAER